MFAQIVNKSHKNTKTTNPLISDFSILSEENIHIFVKQLEL